MQEDTRQRFQGKCLTATEGYRWLTTSYDLFPPKVRERLRESPYNLCSQCVSDLAAKYHGYMPAIDAMEEQIRAGN